jgi:Putative Ig domain
MAITLIVTGCGGGSGSGDSGSVSAVQAQSVAIMTTSLPAAQVGVAYTATLVASGGSSPYTWSVAGGALPTGLSLSATTGVISGTPTTATSNAAVSFAVAASGSPAQTNTVALALTVNPVANTSTSSVSAQSATPITIATASLPAGTVGVAYSASLAATGGTAPYTWHIASGALPTGLAVSAATGVISGTPTTAVTNSPITFSVADSGTPAQTQSVVLSLSVTSSTPAVSITTTSLPKGMVGSTYAATLAASGGTAPYTWRIASGALPAGLTFGAATGVVSGTPTAAVTGSSITFSVTDSGTPAQSQSVVLALTIAASIAPVTISTSSLPKGTVGATYAATLAASGGTAPYTWRLTSGALPAGLTLAAATGVISGTPTAAVSSASLTFSVTDSGTPAQTQSVVLALTVAASGSSAPPLSISTASLPKGTVGSTYAATLAASGGTAPYTWRIANGTLPAGLTLAAGGVISGTPTVAVSNSSLTFSVTDSGTPAQTQSVVLVLTVASNIPPLSIPTASLPKGTVGATYAAALAASGGTAPYGWQITSGALPAGLTLGAATGVISGTPTTAVTSSITFSVTDSGTPAQIKSVVLSLVVANPIPPVTISTTSLANGTVGATYAATLAASGGTAPYTWRITSGALPAGLTLGATTGVISGKPTAAVSNSSITFSVTDSGTPAQTQSVVLSLTVITPPVSITTTVLPNGTVGSTYSATLAASGGTPPYTWSITSGVLPSGLSLAATGVISGVPTAAVTSSLISFSLRDSSNPVQIAAANVSVTVVTPPVTVTVSPTRAGLTVNGSLTVSATTNDVAGVRWSISPSGGSFSAGTSASGVPVVLTAPSGAGVYTVSATSITDNTKIATVTVGVTNLGGVYTFHNDLNRDGANIQEYALTSANVTTGSFGKLFSCPVDGAVYAQPLWVANLTVNGSQHNVVFVVTEHDSLFAFDADAAPCVLLWQVSLIDVAHGAASGETSVPSNLVGTGRGNLYPEIGVTGTPVIDPTTGILYVVSESVDPTQTLFNQRLHAINITTGAEETGAPLAIAATYPGTGAGGSSVAFSPKQELQRTGLALVNGTIYVTWASNEDAAPYYGWVIGYTYNGATLARGPVFNVAPNTGYSGIWMGGGAPAADALGNLYLLTGNGTFNATNTSAPNNDYGDSLLKLATGANLSVAQYFTPSDQLSDQQNDKDFGSGGAAILADLPAGSPVNHLIIGGGKDGSLYVLNRDLLGGSGDTHSWQQIPFGAGIFSTGAYWNDNFYLRGINAPLATYQLNTSTALFSPGPVSGSSYGFPGASPSVSASGTTNGIVWDIDDHLYCTPNSQGCGPAVLHAFSATNVATELWNSSTSSQDAAGNAVKFSVPTIANGKVYLGSRTELDVYGLKPN